ncbi:MAG: S-methyl-5'-thioadenosine phosphorylase [Dehalococcoidia bacterium]|nr:S-methyl-5'-thioadenosine phosphorylase [Dehalococcoidia bacterium]
MTSAAFAVIGGSGFYAIDGLVDAERVTVDTPYGEPSDAVVLGTLDGRRVAFLARHGAAHTILPSEIPARANIWALASLGVRSILSVSAVGSLREEIAPLDLVVPDQLIDRTQGRPSTFFGRGVVAHIAFDLPYCPALSEALIEAASGVTDARVRGGGTMVVIDGPAFSTRAESALYRSWSADIIGMTALPEAKLAREAGICYATLACVTDYDTWHATHAAVSVDLVVANLRANVARAKTIAATLAAHLPAGGGCACASSLRDAVITPHHQIPEERRRELAPILERDAEVAAR